jgi:glycine betaine/proline transport system substrate-binding protein
LHRGNDRRGIRCVSCTNRSFARALLLGVALLLPAAALEAAEQPGAGETVRPARATWDTGWFQVEVYAKALEELGYTVEAPKTLDNPVFYQAVAQGDVDFWVNGWFPQHMEYEEHFRPGAEIVGYVAKGGALQGYMIDKKTADAHGIDSLADLEDPEVAALFDQWLEAARAAS